MVAITKQQIPVLVARLVEFQEGFSELSSSDGQFVIQNTKEAIKLCVEAIKKRQSSKQPILNLISGGHSLVLKALDGKRLICKSGKTFRSGIDGDFVKWGIAKPGIATPATPAQVHEMVGNGTFMDIFRSLPGTWNQKWLSQNQVIEFCETLPDWLRQNGNATFFLVKKDESKPINEDKPEDNLVVVRVRVYSVGLAVRVYQLGLDFVWNAESRHRVVSPQLVPSVA